MSKKTRHHNYRSENYGNAPTARKVLGNNSDLHSLDTDDENDFEAKSRGI